MAISSPGIGSGLDVQSIVSQLVAIEQRPLAKLQTQQSTYNSQLSAFGQVSSKIAALQDAAAAMAKPSAWSMTTSTSSDMTSVTVSSSGTAASGDYSVAVTQLAKAQNLASKPFQSTDVVGTGTLRIEMGSWSGSTFSSKDGTFIDIEIGSEDNTLAAMRTKINAADAGVTASIVNDKDGARLVIRSKETGAENAVRITEQAMREFNTGPNDEFGNPTPEMQMVAISDGELAWLTYDRQGSASSAMQQTVAAQDANASINGLNLVSSSNTFTDVADGMSFVAVKTTSADVTLKVGIDTESFKTAINKFVAAYNAVNTTLRSLTKYDEGSKSGAILQGDRTAVTIQNQLRSLVQGSAGTSTAFTRLADLGISMQRDGSLSTDDAKLSTALAKPAEVGLAMASSADAAPGNRGIAALFESFGKAVTGTDGTLTTRSESLTNRIKLNGKEQDTFNTRIEATRARLLAPIFRTGHQAGRR